MTTWSQLFAGTLPNPTPGDLGKVLVVRAGPAWVADFVQFDDVQGVRSRLVQINLSGAAPPAPVPGSPVLQGVGAAGAIAAVDLVGVGNVARYTGRQSRGTPGAPSATQKNDALASYGASGYGATGWGAVALTGQIFFAASENFTDTAKGTELRVQTTPLLATGPVVSWVFGSEGHIYPFVANTFDIGTPALPVRSGYFGSLLQVNLSGGAAPALIDPGVAAQFVGVVGASGTRVQLDSYVGAPQVNTRQARGTPAAPAATQTGDSLGNFGGRGYGATGFAGSNRAAMVLQAVENWTDTATGANIMFYTTPIGTTSFTPRWQVSHDGHWAPLADNVYDLGYTTSRIRNAYIAGVHATSVWAGPGDQMALSVNPGVYTRLYMDVASGAFWQWSYARNQLEWYPANSSGAGLVLDGAGNVGTGASMFAVSFFPGTSAQRYMLSGDNTASNIIFDNTAPISYLQFQMAQRSLEYRAGGVSLLLIDSAGNTTFTGQIRVGRGANFASDASYSTFYYDFASTKKSYWQLNVSTGEAYYVYDGASKINIGPTVTNFYNALYAPSLQTTGYMGGQGFSTNAGGRAMLVSDTTSAVLYFDITNTSYINYNYTNGLFQYVFHNVVQWSTDQNGVFNFNGRVTQSAGQVMQTPQLVLGPYAVNKFQLLTDVPGTAYSQISWDSPGGYYTRHDYASHNLTYYTPTGSFVVATDGGLFSNRMYANAQHIALIGDNTAATYSQVHLDAAQGACWHFNMSSKHLVWYVNGVPLFAIDPAGNVVAKGTFTTGTPGVFEAMGIFEMTPEEMARAVPTDVFPDRPDTWEIVPVAAEPELLPPPPFDIPALPPPPTPPPVPFELEPV